MYDVTLLVATRNRPRLLSRCIEYMDRQTFLGQMQMVVISDSIETESEMIEGISLSSSNLDIGYFRREPEPGICGPHISHARNLLEGMCYVACEKVLLIEDDDWYSPEYVMDRVNLLEDHELVGRSNTIYYHLEKGWKDNENDNRGTLFETGFTGKRVEILFTHILREQANKGIGFIDLMLWKRAQKMNIKPFIKDEAPPLSIGMKFPDLSLVEGVTPVWGQRYNRGGDKMRGYTPDPGMERLEAVIGKKDTDYYREMLMEETQ